MKIYKSYDVLDYYSRIITSAVMIRINAPHISPFGFKDIIFLDDIVLHAWIESSPENSMYYKIIFNVILHFSEEWFEDDVWELESYLNQEIYTYDENCRCRITCGYTSLRIHTWSKGSRFDPIFSFIIEEFPVKTDILERIKIILNETKMKYKFKYSDKRENIIERIHKKVTP